MRWEHNAEFNEDWSSDLIFITGVMTQTGMLPSVSLPSGNVEIRLLLCPTHKRQFENPYVQTDTAAYLSV
jgi:hypothetical protein